MRMLLVLGCLTLFGLGAGLAACGDDDYGIDYGLQNDQSVDGPGHD
jgi:hypothetical protein